MTRILLVDDSEQWRDAERTILEAVPSFRIMGEASDGLEAIEQTSRLCPDIVLLDIGMPLLNGIDAAQQIQKDSPSSRVVFVTQDDDADIRDAALATGAAGYLLKANAVSELLPAIEAAFQNGHDSGDRTSKGDIASFVSNRLLVEKRLPTAMGRERE